MDLVAHFAIPALKMMNQEEHYKSEGSKDCKEKGSPVSVIGSGME